MQGSHNKQDATQTEWSDSGATCWTRSVWAHSNDLRCTWQVWRHDDETRTPRGRCSVATAQCLCAPVGNTTTHSSASHLKPTSQSTLNNTINRFILHWLFKDKLVAFSALTLLVQCQEEHPELAWLSVYSEVQMICIWSGWCLCHPIISCFIRNGFTFWCRLTQVVLERGS